MNGLDVRHENLFQISGTPNPIESVAESCAWFILALLSPCFLLDIIPLGRFHLCRNALMQLTQITFRPFTLAVMVNFFGHASME